MTDKLKFCLREGFYHAYGTDDEKGPGEVVELTAEEAKGFMDKLEPVDRGDTGKVVQAGERAKLEKMSVPNLRKLPEWAEVESPKPTKREKIVDAIMQVRANQKKAE